MAHIEQADCDAIETKLNSRPRKRLDYSTPEECYAQS
jgi:IS30 family transposase